MAEFVGTMNRLAGVARDGYLEVTGGRIPWHYAEEGAVEVLFRPDRAIRIDPRALLVLE